jgi:hypothetical protein
MSEILDFDPDALRKYRHERDRRLGPDANDQYVEVTADFRHYIDDPHVDPGFARKALSDIVDVVIVGGGFGGLLAAARLRESVRLAGDHSRYRNRHPRFPTGLHPGLLQWGRPRRGRPRPVRQPIRPRVGRLLRPDQGLARGGRLVRAQGALTSSRVLVSTTRQPTKQRSPRAP